MSLEKRVNNLEEVTFGGKNPQDSIIAIVHNNSKLTSELLNVVKSTKRWIITTLLATLTAVFYMGYKAAQFDVSLIKMQQFEVRITKLEHNI